MVTVQISDLPTNFFRVLNDLETRRAVLQGRLFKENLKGIKNLELVSQLKDEVEVYYDKVRLWKDIHYGNL